MALPQESRGLWNAPARSVLYTGVGKVNAAVHAGGAAAEMRCTGRPMPLVREPRDGRQPHLPRIRWWRANRFSQRDMDVSGLGFEPGVTPFDDTPASSSFAPRFTQLQQCRCLHRGFFATHLHSRRGDVVDMEAFALARVCRAENASFACAQIHHRRRRQRFRGPLGGGARSRGAEFLALYSSSSCARMSEHRTAPSAAS
jgi:adenosylhomocysteine nucleosidase